LPFNKTAATDIFCTRINFFFHENHLFLPRIHPIKEEIVMALRQTNIGTLSANCYFSGTNIYWHHNVTKKHFFEIVFLQENFKSPLNRRILYDFVLQHELN